MMAYTSKQAMTTGVDLVGIAGQVKQLAVVCIQEVHQLPVATPDHGLKVMGREVDLASRLAEDVLASGPRIARERGEQRFGLHFARGFPSCQFQDGRSNVEQGA